MEEEKKEYWTESTLLKERGWSKGRIAKLLKNPDKLVPNPHYRTASKMRLYSQSRVLAAEASPEFIAFKTSAPTRAEKAATQQQRQINESSFPETFCRDMPEKLWLALSPRPEFEAEAIEIVVQIALAALDARRPSPTCRAAFRSGRTNIRHMAWAAQSRNRRWRRGFCVYIHGGDCAKWQKGLSIGRPSRLRLRPAQPDFNPTMVSRTVIFSTANFTRR